MADIKPSAFTNTAPASETADFVPYTKDVTGTPLDRRMSIRELFTASSLLTTITDIDSDSADYITIYQANGTVAKKITIDNLYKGVQDIPIPASAFYVTTTEPATYASVEYGSAGQKITLKSMNYTSTSADERAQCEFTLPRQYDLGTIDVVIKYSFASGSGNIRWGARAVSFADNDAIATSFGTAVEGNDTAGTVDQFNFYTGLTGITIGNTPAAGDTILLEIYREGSDAGDTFSGTARLHEVIVRVGVNKKASA